MIDLERVIRDELLNVETRFQVGKGTYGQSDYIKDDDWAFLKGERYALRYILQMVGLKP